jgi:hypothetical protein
MPSMYLLQLTCLMKCNAWSLMRFSCVPFRSNCACIGASERFLCSLACCWESGALLILLFVCVLCHFQDFSCCLFLSRLFSTSLYLSFGMALYLLFLLFYGFSPCVVLVCYILLLLNRVLYFPLAYCLIALLSGMCMLFRSLFLY